MLDGAAMEKAPLTQYVRRGLHKKALFTENTRQGWYKKAPFSQYLLIYFIYLNPYLPLV